MNQQNTTRPNGERAPRGASVDALAARVLSVLRNRNTSTSSPRNDAIHNTLREAVLAPTGFSNDRTLEKLRDMGVPDIDLVDVFIPDLAREMGVCWTEDTLSFGQVSLATARLQGMVPYLELGHLKLDQNACQRIDAKMLLIVSPNDQHTLGPMIFAAQLRRLGYCVRLSLGQGLDGLRSAEALDDYELILFSCSYRETLATVCEIVSFLHDFGDERPRTVLGGPVVGYVENLKALTGVDLVTNDVSLALLGLESTPSAFLEKAAE